MAHATRSPKEPLLDVRDIQGNILAGFNKDQQRLLALAFGDLPAARRWLRRIVGEISSLERARAEFQVTVPSKYRQSSPLREQW